MSKLRKQISAWLYVGEDKKLHKTKYGYLTNSQWLLKEQERFKKLGIDTAIKTKPENETEAALFYKSKNDIPHYDTPAEMRKSVKND